MKRCSFRGWTPILPWPIWPLAGQCSWGQNAVVGSMTLLLAVRGNIATRSMSGPPFALQLHRTTVWCGATPEVAGVEYRIDRGRRLPGLHFTRRVGPGVEDRRIRSATVFLR